MYVSSEPIGVDWKATLINNTQKDYHDVRKRMLCLIAEMGE